MIFLVRHGEAKANPQTGDKELTPDGIAKVEKLGQYLAPLMQKPGNIFHSGITRALQTAKLIAQKNSWPVNQLSGMSPMDEPGGLLQHIDPEANQMFVAHNPFMSRVVSLLVTGNNLAGIYSFDTACCVGLYPDYDQKGKFVLKWILDPYLLPEL